MTLYELRSFHQLLKSTSICITYLNIYFYCKSQTSCQLVSVRVRVFNLCFYLKYHCKRSIYYISAYIIITRKRDFLVHFMKYSMLRKNEMNFPSLNYFEFQKHMLLHNNLADNKQGLNYNFYNWGGSYILIYHFI